MKNLIKYCLMAAFMFAAFSSNAFADMKLPAPQTSGGMGLFDALDRRSSVAGGDFSTAPITNEELSTVLWAATGLNRGGKGWTVPMAKGQEPYCNVYVAGENGVFLYDWKEHALKEISAENIKAKIGVQSFVKKAYYSLIFVSDAKRLEYFNNPEKASRFAEVAVGAMTQDVYLAAAALNLGTRYIHSINADEIRRALKLPEGDQPIALMLLGK